MKIFKQREHGLLLKSFGLGGKLYLAVTVMIFYDLQGPDTPLTEQELWQTIPGQLNKGEVLDQGLPKPRGEVLVTGICSVPQGRPQTGLEVAFQVGPLKKSLFVFGHRHWEKGGLISKPEPFAVMPISYANAFGGDGFEPNPLGKGIHPVHSPDGQSKIPLPNIENPRQLIKSHKDRPSPAGFGPLDMMWPPRAKKRGTYDLKWLSQRWPYFPDDLKHEFFNVAPEDQFITGYFQGDEPLSAFNFHADFPSLTSRLPGLRVRCFATKLKDLKSTQEELIFQELVTHLDTVWLFPSILRGLVMYRGATEIQDDEYPEIKRLFVASEKLSQAPKPVEYYLEEQRKAADLGVPVDAAPGRQGQEKLAQAMKKVRRIPKKLEAAKLKALGQAPKMPRSTEEIITGAKDKINQRLAALTELEGRTTASQARLGPGFQIKSGLYDHLREKLSALSGKIEKLGAKLGESLPTATGIQEKLAADFKLKAPPAALQAAGQSPAELTFKPKEPQNPWHEQGFSFVVQSRKNLEKDHQAQSALRALGLEEETIKRAWLGINYEELRTEAKRWGLVGEEKGSDSAEIMILPPGLVIPRFDGPTLAGLTIRLGDYGRTGQDRLIEGSSLEPLWLPAPSMLPTAPVVCVAHSLEAWLLEQEIGDFGGVIALKDPGVKPGPQAVEAIGSALAFLIVQPAPPAGPPPDFTPWLAAYPQAQILEIPEGSTLFEAWAKGHDLRRWVLAALPREFAFEHELEHEPLPRRPGEKPPRPKVALPQINGAALAASFKKDLTAAVQSRTAATEQLQEEIKQKLAGKLREVAAKTNKTPEALLAASRESATRAPVLDGAASTPAKVREVLKSAGRLTPDMEKRLQAGEENIARLKGELEARLAPGLAQAAAAKEKAAALKAGPAGGMPPEAKEKLKAAGIDLDRRIKFTREEVIDRYQRGETLAHAILSGLDLSGLELPGIDLSHAVLKQTSFRQTNLDGAKLVQASAQGADFSEASLKDAQLSKGNFSKALFVEAKLSQANLDQALLKGADLTRADLSGAQMKMTSLGKAMLVEALLRETQGNMLSFSGADLTKADLTRSVMIRALFHKTILDLADFSMSSLEATVFKEAVGEKVKFTEARFTRVIMNESHLPGVHFGRANLIYSNFRDSDLSGAYFRESRLKESIFEKCVLVEANFQKVAAQKSRFPKSNLESADLRAINLMMGSLRKARLVNTDLRGSNLFAVDFFRATFGGTKLAQANLKRTILYKVTEVLK